MNSNPHFILSATDFSPQAGEAATVAAKLARGRSERLQLVHVVAAAKATKQKIADRRQELNAEAFRLRTLGAEVEAVLLEGESAEGTLLAHIRTERPGLVVVASPVRNRFDRWAHRSFSERIAESAPVPTLIVRDPGAFESWDWVKKRLTILVALDLHPSSDVVLRWVREFRVAGPCDVIACHVHWRRLDGAARSRDNPGETKAGLERELRKKMRDLTGDDDGTIVVRPYDETPEDGIVDIAGEVDAQLIAVGTHQRSGLRRLIHGSVSRELLHAAVSTNIVCVPLTAEFDPREAHVPDFRRVLVATDLSETGNAAVPFACAACSPEGTVKIVHVTACRSVPPRAAGGGGGLEAQLRALIPRETTGRGQRFEVEILAKRAVADAICDEAGRFGADLVVVASHGRGASRAWHGSVAKEVLKKIRRPLLVIRRPDE